MLTIARFAERTGLSPSALRFYERKELLRPDGRLENGYRVYAARQVADARLIHSLRQAGVALADIRRFLEQKPDSRAEMLVRWRQEATARLLTMQLAEQYLQGLHADEPQVHLQRWERPSLLLWFPAKAPLQPLPFGGAIVEWRRVLKQAGLPLLGGGYVRTLDKTAAGLVGEVGFRLEAGRRRRLPAQARIQEVAPTLFTSLECTVDDEKAAHRIFRLLDHFGLAPGRLHLEQYLPGTSSRYLLLVEVGPRARRD